MCHRSAKTTQLDREGGFDVQLNEQDLDLVRPRVPFCVVLIRCSAPSPGGQDASGEEARSHGQAWACMRRRRSMVL